MSNVLTAIRRLGKGKHGVEDAVSYGLGHRIRIEIRAALHEGPMCLDELSKALGRPLSSIAHHVEALYEDGSIEIAWTRRVRGRINQHFYAVTELPEYSEEELAAMDPADRKALAALIIQSATSEALAALWAGTLHDHPRVMLAWNWLLLDEQGRADMADEDARSWERKHEIAGEAANRRAKSGEKGKKYVIAVYCFERAKDAPPSQFSFGQD